MRLLRGCNNSDGIAQEKAAVPGRHGGEGTSPERGFGSGGELTHLAGGAEQFDRRACLAAALTPSAGFLILVIFLLRQSGQGLASHVSVTAMVKYFRHNRGKAIALASLGHPLARAGMPLAAVVLIALFGWRATYAICAVLVVLVLLPSIAWLLADGTEARLFDPQSARQRKSSTPGAPDQRLGDLLRDRFFYLVMPGIIAPSAIDTALFFHLLTIAEIKGWSPAWVTGGYAIYALAVVIVSCIRLPKSRSLKGTDRPIPSAEARSR